MANSGSGITCAIPRASAAAPATAECDNGTGGATVTYGSASASDACNGTLPANCSPASGSTFPLGSSVAVWE